MCCRTRSDAREGKEAASSFISVKSRLKRRRGIRDDGHMCTHKMKERNLLSLLNHVEY